MALYQVTNSVTVEAADEVEAAQKAYALHAEAAPHEFEVLRADGYREEEDADIGTVSLDEDQKLAARKWLKQADLFIEMLDQRGAVDKMKR
jgi:hypothetical protein